MGLKEKLFRAGDVERLDAVGDISWLNETGFWSMVTKKIEKTIASELNRLSNPNNTYEDDLIIKGTILGIKRAMKDIDTIKNSVQKSQGGQ